MSGFLPTIRRSARCSNRFSKRFRVNPWRKAETARAGNPMRARLQRLSRQAGWKAAMCAAQSQNICNLPSHICVAICRNKTVICPVMRRECAAGADLTAIDLTEVRDDG